MSQTLRFRIVNVALLLVIAFVWASSFGAIKVAVYDTGPISLAAIRASGAAVILGVWLAASGPIPWQTYKDHMGAFFMIGGVGTALPFIIIPFAELEIESALAGLLMALGPLATLIGAWALGYQDDVSRGRFFGILLGLVGAGLLLSDGFRTLGTGHLVAQIMTIFASLCYVAGNLTVRKIAHIHWLVISTGSMFVASLILWPLALVIEQPSPFDWSALSWGMLIWLAAMPTAFAFSIRYLLIARAGPTFTSYVGYLIPAMAMLLGYSLLDEVITATHLGALCLILLGLILAQTKSKAQK